MSQAPRHSKPVTKMSSLALGRGAEGVEQLVAAPHPAADVGADGDLVGADRLGVEEVVEAGDGLEVGGRHPHHRGRLADALRGAPAVAALHRPERRDRGRFAVRVAAHQLLDVLPQLRRAVDLVQLGDRLRGCGRGRGPRSARRSTGRAALTMPGPSTGSPVDPAEDRVEHPEAADHVGDVAVDRHVLERLQVDEGGVAEVDPGRLRGAVGEDEAAELAARALDRVVDLARAPPGSPR